MIRFFGTGLAKRIGTPPQIKKYDNGNKFLYNILCFPEKSTFPRTDFLPIRSGEYGGADVDQVRELVVERLVLRERKRLGLDRVE